MRTKESALHLTLALFFGCLFTVNGQQKPLNYDGLFFMTDQKIYTPIKSIKSDNPGSDTRSPSGYKIEGNYIWPTYSHAKNKADLVIPNSMDYFKYDGPGFITPLTSTLPIQGFTKSASFRIYYTTGIIPDHKNIDKAEEIFKNKLNTEIEQIVAHYANVYVPDYEYCYRCFVTYQKVYYNGIVDDSWTQSYGWGYEWTDPNSGRKMRGAMTNSGGSRRMQKNYFILGTIYKNPELAAKRSVSYSASPKIKDYRYYETNTTTSSTTTTTKKKPATAPKPPAKVGYTQNVFDAREGRSKQVTRNYNVHFPPKWKKEEFEASREKWTKFLRKKYGKKWAQKWNEELTFKQKYKTIEKFEHNAICPDISHYVGLGYKGRIKKELMCNYWDEDPLYCKEKEE